MRLLKINGGVIGFGRMLRPGEIIDLEKEKRPGDAALLVGCGVAEYVERYPIPVPAPVPEHAPPFRNQRTKESSAPKTTKRVYRKRQK